MKRPPPSGPVLLYDGDCAFCHAVVRWILRHERRHTLRFAALRSEFGRAAAARHPALQTVDSVVWLAPLSAGHPERACVRSDAILRVAAYLGGPWRLAAIARLVPRRWRDAAYDRVARRRRRRPGTSAACQVPEPSSAERFGDPNS